MKEKHVEMTALACSFIGIFALLFLSYGYNHATEEGPFNATRVLDGDTIELDNGMTIRLSAINAAETGTCYAAEAKEELARLVLNKQVELERDIDDMDSYGRYLRYVYVDGIDVNLYLVEDGYVKVFDKYNTTTKRYEEFKEAEKNPRENKKGIWSCKDYTEECMYVASKNSKVYHKPECKWAKKIKEDNLICFKSEDELEGYEPAKSC